MTPNTQGSPENFLYECRLLTHDTGHTPNGVTTSFFVPGAPGPRRRLPGAGWPPVRPHEADVAPGQGRGTVSPGGQHEDFVAKN